MSFKRDGDDKNALNSQRKRRVADLLFEDIHDREVSKLRNGRLIADHCVINNYVRKWLWKEIWCRVLVKEAQGKHQYVCKLCQHAPTFDTISMFQVHKQGKKHQNSLVYHELKDKEIQDLILKRQHEKDIESETENIQVSVGERKPLQLESRKKSKQYHRKLAIDLHQSPPPYSIDATPQQTLPGNRFVRQTSSSVSSVSPKEGIESRDRADISSHLQSRDKAFVPGTKHHNRASESVEDNEQELELKNVRKFINQGGENNSSKFYFSRRQLNSSKHVPNVRMNLERQHVVVEKHTALSWDKFKQMKGKSFVAPIYQSKERSDDRDKGDVVSTPEIGNQPICSVSNTITKQRAQEYLKAVGSGWKRDWDGNWIQDEDAEFDSDEEPPNIT